ncbi:MAG: FG-GAP repeat domain-containing protein, partial [Betaproteobacteria bacterium]
MKNPTLAALVFFLILPIAHAFNKISSYQNSKHPPFYSETFPVDSWGHSPQLSEARAFFKFIDGSNGLLTNEHGYQVHNHTLQQAKPGVVNFYLMNNSEWIKADVKINYKAETCIHARKIVSADFNNDNLIDFAFMCQGYDAMPFPGEKMKILLSKSTNEYDFQILHDDVDFYHGGASEDFNGDGLPDLLVGT